VTLPDVALVLDVQADLGEGALWDERRRRLVFVDIMRGHIHAFDPSTGDDERFELGQPVGAVGCTTEDDWIVAAGRSFLRFDPDRRQTTVIAIVSPGRDDLRMNDGYVDPRGRFWAGTMSLRREAGQGSLYRLDPDGRVHTMLDGVTTSNGIDWSPDGRRMYYVDTRTRRVDVFDFDLDAGTIANRRPFADLGDEAGRPDGLVVDADGGVWVALWQGGGLRRFTADGVLDRRVTLPTRLTTKCAFGGPALEDLYVTTARGDLSAEQRAAEPLAGGLFRVRGVGRGRPCNRFGSHG
jgi:sugar lactone lactonase YvrE